MGTRTGSPDGQAWHEAGHAVIAHRFGGRVRSLTLETEDDGFEGRAAVEWTAGGTKEQALASACTALAGPLAELAFEGTIDPDDESVRSAWRGDWDEVEHCAAIVEPDPEQRTALIQSWLREVERMIAEPRTHETIARVADALDAHGTLDETLVEECLSD